MAILAYDYNMIGAPELLVPGEKPVGPVQINWDHPLTDNLLESYILQPNYRHDLVRGSILTQDSAEYVSNGLEVLSNDHPTINTPAGFNTSNGWVAFGFTGTGTPHNYARLLYSTDLNLFLNNGTGNLNLTIGGSTTVVIPAVPSLWDGKRHHITVGWDDSTNVRRIVVDGINYSAGVAFTSAGIGSTINIGNYLSGTDRTCAGIFHYLHFFKNFTGVNGGIELQFTRNPYKIYQAI